MTNECWLTRIADRWMDIGATFVLWPHDLARGTHWSWRVLVLTAGWFWVIPAIVISVVVFMLPVLLLGLFGVLWDEMKQP